MNLFVIHKTYLSIQDNSFSSISEQGLNVKMNDAFQGHIISLEFTLKLARDFIFEGCQLLWINPSQQLISTQPPTHSPMMEWGKELEG